MKEEELLHEIKGGIGWVTLNRTKALNALSLQMIRDLQILLNQWEKNDAVKAVVIQGAGDKAFCAGGDVRAVYDAKKANDLKTCDAFFREEYILNAHIHHYSKPYVAIIDGIAMGGGLGVSINGSHRIVTERALLAMPETGLGFFPDVGATTFLNNAPGHVGPYLGLTGTRLEADDALWVGLATHHMPSSSLASFIADLREGKSFEETLTRYAQMPPKKGFLEHHFENIETHFGKSTLQEVFESLEKDPSPFAQNTLNTLRSKSPTSLAVTFRQLNVGKNLSFEDRMNMEFCLSQHFVKGHDFMEGVRAILVDKDRLPQWEPTTIEEVTREEVDRYFT